MIILQIRFGTLCCVFNHSTILKYFFQYEDFHENRKLVNWTNWNDHPERREKDIVWVLSKIKAKVICSLASCLDLPVTIELTITLAVLQVVRERVRIKDAMQDYDKFNHSVIMKEDFERVLNVLGFGLTRTEMATLVEV